MINVPIIIIFYNRPQFFNKVLKNILSNSPKKIYLVSDGPKNSKDNENVIKCREIAESLL